MTSISPEKYPKSWHIEILCKLCKKMTYEEIKNNNLLDWYANHLKSDYHFNSLSVKEELLLKFIENGDLFSKKMIEEFMKMKGESSND